MGQPAVIRQHGYGMLILVIACVFLRDTRTRFSAVPSTTRAIQLLLVPRITRAASGSAKEYVAMSVLVFYQFRFEYLNISVIRKKVLSYSKEQTNKNMNI